MVNIFIVGASEKFLNSRIIERTLQKSKIDKTYLLIHEKSQIKYYDKFGMCYFREDCAKGYYDESLIDMSKCIPLDDEIFNYMAPYTLEIMNQQRRFEEYHAFSISKAFEDHYTIYMRNLFFWNNMLEEKKITHVFFPCIPHEGYDSVIYHLCKMKNISVQMVYNSTLPKRYYLLNDYLHPEDGLGEVYKYMLDKYKDSDVVPLDEAAEKLFEKWTSLEPDKMKPWYMEGNPLKQRFSTRFGVTNIFVAWKALINSIYSGYNYRLCWKFLGSCFFKIPDFVKTIFVTYRRWNYARPVWKRTLELNRFYESIAEMPVEGERYVYFALHYQPEASSNPLGVREYTDQIFAINLLARSLPEDMKVYVKVHPEQLAPLRSKDYYLDIKRINNIRIIKSQCSTYNLIQNAFAVSSLTGTVCWESQFFGIPAILFGYSQKNLAPLSYHVRTYEECRDAIQGIAEKRKTATKKELRILLKAMYDQSFDKKDIEKVLPEIMIAFFQNREYKL